MSGSCIDILQCCTITSHQPASTLRVRDNITAVPTFSSKDNYLLVSFEIQPGYIIIGISASNFQTKIAVFITESIFLMPQYSPIFQRV